MGSSPAPLPSLDHFHFSDYDSFYEPAEDTYLLVDVLHEDSEWLQKRAPRICMELGPGSGAVITSLGTLLGRLGHNSLLFAVDVNPSAAHATARTAAANGVTMLEVVCADLALPAVHRLAGTIDVLVFNPPYVPTPSAEVGTGDIAAAWAGGHRGREVIDRALPLFPRLLSPGGCVYIVLVEENRPKEVAAWMEQHGLTAETLASRRAKNELLCVVKGTRRRAEATGAGRIAAEQFREVVEERDIYGCISNEKDRHSRRPSDERGAFKS